MYCPLLQTIQLFAALFAAEKPAAFRVQYERLGMLHPKAAFDGGKRSAAA